MRVSLCKITFVKRSKNPPQNAQSGYLTSFYKILQGKTRVKALSSKKHYKTIQIKQDLIKYLG